MLRYQVVRQWKSASSRAHLRADDETMTLCGLRAEAFPAGARTGIPMWSDPTTRRCDSCQGWYRDAIDKMADDAERREEAHR